VAVKVLEQLGVDVVAMRNDVLTRVKGAG